MFVYHVTLRFVQLLRTDEIEANLQELSRLPERAPWEEVDRFLVELRLSEFSSR
jgi:hypothetical protein